MPIKIARLGEHSATALAVTELYDYILKMDPSADVAVLKEAAYDPERGDVLWVGLDKAFAGLLPTVEDPALDDAIYLKVDGAAGIVTGVNARSVLIAAYRLLRENGARFLRPGADGELLPRVDARTLAASVCEKASSRHRGVTIEGSNSFAHAMNMVKFLPKIGMNAYFIQFFTPSVFFDRWYDAKGEPLSRADVCGMRDELIREVKRRDLLLHQIGHGWTCGTLGIESGSWEAGSYEIPEETRLWAAEVKGKREIWQGIALNTNLCMGNPDVRDALVRLMADYVSAHKEIDYLHFWLGDAANNFCECPLCADETPSDHYVKILNQLDEELTRRGLTARVVFLLYLDLLWAPKTERIHNPDRFTLMFAPITRSYSKLFLPDAPFEGNLPPYKRNANELPKSVAENLQMLKVWREQFGGDGFDFDYHLMWDHLKDPGYYACAKILMSDMKTLRRIGLNGMLSCQLQRCFFPNSLPMLCMAEALWNDGASFERFAEDYFASAYGADGEKARAFLEGLSEVADSPYIRGEKPRVSAEQAETYRKAAPYIAAFLPVIEENLRRPLPPAQAYAWRVLKAHCALTEKLLHTFERLADGDGRGTRAACEEVRAAALTTEAAFPDDLDAFEYRQILSWMLPSAEAGD